MSYVPPAPTPTPEVCDGGPWRNVDGVIECLGLPATGGAVSADMLTLLLVLGMAMVAVGIVVFLGIAAARTRDRERREAMQRHPAGKAQQ